MNAKFFLFFLLSIPIVTCYAQVGSDTIVNSYGCKGQLTECLELLAEKTNTTFNYKNSLTDKKRLLLTKGNYSLGYVLSEIERQCEVGFEELEHKKILLYGKKGKFVYGIIRNAFSSEPIPNAAIKTQTNDRLFYSDKDGQFRFYAYQVSQDITIYHSEFQEFTVELRPEQTRLNLQLFPITELDSVDVKQEENKYLSLKPFEKVVPSDNVLPAPGGEIDALNSVKLLAGIGNTTLSDQGLVVRGGSPDQNFTLLDGIPIYNNFHVLGLFSIFNSPNIGSINVHKDAFPIKYNSRLSSVLEVNLKQGNKKKLEIDADIGALSSGVSLNGPIVKEKLSFSMSARRTYADLLARPIQSIQNQENERINRSALWAYDLYGKLHWQVNDDHQLSITAYNGGDQINLRNRFEPENESQLIERTKGAVGWRNALAGLNWNSRLSNTFFWNVTASTSQYTMTFEDEYDLSGDDILEYSNATFSNGLQENRVGTDVEWAWNRRNLLAAGGGIVNYSFSPLTRSYSSITTTQSIDTSLIYDLVSSNEAFAFIENKSYFDGGYILFGLRAAFFKVRKQTYRRFQPKLLLIQNIGNDNQLKFSLTSSHQFVHLVPNNTLGFPIDVWLPVTENIQPMSSTQLSTRFIRRKQNWLFEVGVFSKFYNSLLEYEAGAQTLLPTSWENSLRAGSGRVGGVEQTIKYSSGKYNFFSAYTYARSRRTVSGINQDIEYFSKYDRPHSYSLIFEYSPSSNWRYLMSWNFSSGNPITVPSGRYVAEINGEEVIIEEFTELNNFRLPATHHLDISLIKTKQHKSFRSKFIVGVYNVYNRFNPYMLFSGIDEEGNQTYRVRSYLPILPMIKYQIKL